MTKTSKTPKQACSGSKVLVIDDEEMLAWSIETELKANGVDVLSCGTLRAALEAFPSFNPDLVICDLRLPDGSGMELLKKWHIDRPDMPFILITAHGAVESAIDALRFGAFDYLQKPFNLKALTATVNRAAEISFLRQKVKQLTARVSVREPLHIIGESAAIRRMKTQLERVAKSNASTVLITGESGTGKELAARAVHEWSARSEMPFIEINCASIPENLLESELFGYEKGAFTDARERKLGLFEIAQSGTIFLDEIGELPLKLQTKLLRALESRRFTRLGGTREVSFSARIVAATNRRLLDEVAAGHFRGDLYYRLSALPLTLPPLRERMEDIELLVPFFLQKLSEELGVRPSTISSPALARLKSHSWPGNLRELKNTLERALVFFEPELITPEHIELDPVARDTSHAKPTLPVSGVSKDTEEPAAGGATFFKLPERGIDLELLERDLLTQALAKAHNNQTKAAELLHISRHTLRYRLEKHDLVQLG